MNSTLIQYTDYNPIWIGILIMLAIALFIGILFQRSRIKELEQNTNSISLMHFNKWRTETLEREKSLMKKDFENQLREDKEIWRKYERADAIKGSKRSSAGN